MCEGLLLFVGLYSLVTGRFRVGRRMVIGQRARLIGGILMLPSAFGIIAAFTIVGTNPGFNGDLENINWNAMNSIITLETALMIGAVITAVALALTTPEAETVSATPSQETVHPVSVPSVLTLTEAAQYLRISEAEVIQLIDDGKITAARIGGDYRIARIVLDELLQSREN